jgi:hypothetical protein
MKIDDPPVHSERSGSPPMTTLSDAWQAALAAEQRAAFGYALLGPRLDVTHQGLARDCQAAHEDTRDATADALAAAGLTPAAPHGDYPALYPAAQHPNVLAATLEDDCAAAWRFTYAQAAVASKSGAPDPLSGNALTVRKQAQGALTASAVRATRWRVLAHAVRPVVAFPGSS